MFYLLLFFYVIVQQYSLSLFDQRLQRANSLYSILKTSIYTYVDKFEDNRSKVESKIEIFWLDGPVYKWEILNHKVACLPY